MHIGTANPCRLLARLRFRTRTLLIFTAVVCVLLGAFAYQLQQAKRARLLAEHLQKTNSISPYLYQPRTTFGISANIIPYWKELADWFEEPYLYHAIEYLHIYADRVTDAELSEIANLLPCEHVVVDHSGLSDIGMSHIARMRLKGLRLCDLAVSPAAISQLARIHSLEHLLVRGRNVTDAHLAHVAQLKHVQEIQLVDTSMTEVGLQHVAKMPALRYLFIATSHLSDAQIDVIAGMHFLERLDLCSVGLDNARLARLSRLPNVNSLMLFNNPITKDGLASIKQLTYLDALDLRSTQIGDDGIPAIIELRGLQRLEFNTDNRLSKNALAELGQALPQLQNRSPRRLSPGNPHPFCNPIAPVGPYFPSIDEQVIRPGLVIPSVARNPPAVGSPRIDGMNQQTKLIRT